MEIMERNYLKQGDKIRLSRIQGNRRGSECEILDKMGEGASCICYHAVFEGTEGVLKEFYPIDAVIGGETEYYFLKRTSSNQLAPVGKAMTQRFGKRCEEFISGYKKLDEARKRDAKNRILNNYIPVYSILYGAGEDGQQNSVYIWNANDKTGETFETYLEAVRSNPEDYPVRKVFHILNTVLTLTDCVKALHTAGLLHLDIKPSNFLVPYNSKFDINPHSISLFDVDTLYSVGNVYSSLAGTPGFVAPEVKRGRGENRSDIYSLGAMLFYSLIISKDLGEGTYQEEYYGQLDQYIQGSELLGASEITSNVFFQACIAEILKKCLAKRVRDRYRNCEELMEDLEKALAYIIPTVMNENLADTTKKLAVLEEKEVSDETLTTRIQNLLYKRPLYEDVKEEETQINVLVLGAGTYAQKFIDQCLQAGQMKNKSLHITAVSGNPAGDKEIYLQFRPALAEFVNVDGSLDGTEKESYGTLRFVPVPGKRGRFSRTDREYNKEALRRILKGREWSSGVDYVFIALSDEVLNQEVAAAYKSLPEWDKCPVCTYERDCDDEMDPKLKQMAFHTHLSWKNSLNIDMEEVWKEFKIKYNYESSLAYALSIKYKLRSLGIDMDDVDFAAWQFEEEADKNDLEELTALEHRRWVLEKITTGWQAAKDPFGRIDYEGCADRVLETGRTYDKIRKLHPCIVRSTKERPLENRKKSEWDKAEILEGLDELDTVSVCMHQECKRRGIPYLYKEYKSNDRILVERIPFILTYKASPYMLIPFENDGKVNKLVNVASAAFLAPAKITYIAYCSGKTQLQRLPGKIAATAEYYQARKMHVNISLLLFIKKDISEEEKEKGRMRLSEIGLNDLKTAECEDEAQCLRMLPKLVGNRRIDLLDVTPKLFADQAWNKKFEKKLGGKYPYFEFDLERNCFAWTQDCGYLNRIRIRPEIHPENIGVLKELSDFSMNWLDGEILKDREQDIKELYYGISSEPKKIEERQKCWEALSSNLASYSRQHDLQIRIKEEKGLFSCCFCEGDREISVITDNKLLECLKDLRIEQLEVKHFPVTKEEEKLLAECAEKGFLCDYKVKKGEAGFFYKSSQVKYMFTRPGWIWSYLLCLSMRNSDSDLKEVWPGFSWKKNGRTYSVECAVSHGCRMVLWVCDFDGTRTEEIEEIQDMFGKDAVVTGILSRGFFEVSGQNPCSV